MYFSHIKDGDLISGMVQDCTPIAERTKAMHNMGFTGPSSDMKFAASIPLVFIEKYLIDNNITYHEFAVSQEHKKRLVMDPALSHFRVWKGNF